MASSYHSGGARVGAALAVAFALLAGTEATAQPLALVNLSHSFPPGPYSAIAVDPSNTNRIAVATDSGLVGFSADGGLVASELPAIIHRKYDSMAIRGGASRANLSAARPKGDRATRLFLYQLQQGLPAPRWAYWMAMGEPVTQISDIALPAPGGDMYIAGPYGIVLGKDRGAAWQRVLGGPGPMQREKDMMGMSVVIDPGNPRHVFAATDRGVFESDDGGANFRVVSSAIMQDRYIARWYWDASNPDLLFAVDTYEVLLSDDRGKSFESVFAAGGEIRDVSMAGDAVHIATSEGMYIVGSGGTRHVLAKEDVLGAVGMEGGSLAITKDTLYWIYPDDRVVRMAHTSTTDVYQRLVGGGDKAWLLSRHAVMRLGPALERRTEDGYKPPKLLMSMADVESAFLRHNELGRPVKTRMYERWYAKWAPRLVVTATGDLEKGDNIMYDGTFPVRYRQAQANSRSEVVWSAMMFFDLTHFLPGSNASNPYAFIESNLRENRKAMLAELRWRYREVAALVAQLRRPPADPFLELAWRSRLEEYGAYLEFMSGRQVLANVME